MSPCLSPAVRLLEEDSEFDEDVARVLDGADGDPDKIRSNVRHMDESVGETAYEGQGVFMDSRVSRHP